MARTTSNSSPRTPSRASKRPRTPPATNTLRPSPALVSWVNRTIQRFTAEPPWTYEDDVPVAARATPAPPAAAQPPLQAGSPVVTEQGSPAVPAEVRERFIRVGRDYYFPSGARAFRDHGQKVVTRSENIEVIRSFVQIAQARGWQDITVTGTKRFRREAWRIATVSGLIVRGYRPTEIEKQKFVRDLAQAREPPRPHEPLVDPPASRAPPAASAAVVAAEHAPPAPRPPRSPAPRSPARRGGNGARSPEGAQPGSNEPARAARPKSERVYSGTLLEHGEAPYEFQADGEPSYFLRIQTPRGPKVLWGLDFPRALQAAKVQPGDQIHVRQAGREKVTVKQRERDEAGRVVGEREVPAHRNQWEISHGDKSRAGRKAGDLGRALREPQADVREAARDDPALASALLALRGAQVFADARIPNSRQRAAFVNAVREQLAQVLDRGSAMPTPPLRERARQHAPAAAPTLS